MRFSDQLRQTAADVWEAQLEHPFVCGIRDGTLDPERFRFYMCQDYLFLIEYGRLLALACARAPRLELMERFAELAQSILTTEMDLHRDYAAEWGISREALERERPHDVTRGYTDFLLRTAALGDFGELVAALLPCMWDYSELGQRLAQDQPTGDGRYARWIEMYSGQEFANLARWCREVCDEAGAGAAEQGRRRMQDAFVTSSRYELAFWEQAWRGTAKPRSPR
jgi:thiaminase (transcriptional activator TenA)